MGLWCLGFGTRVNDRIAESMIELSSVFLSNLDFSSHFHACSICKSYYFLQG